MKRTISAMPASRTSEPRIVNTRSGSYIAYVRTIVAIWCVT